jgi:hypothetical protein
LDSFEQTLPERKSTANFVQHPAKGRRLWHYLHIFYLRHLLICLSLGLGSHAVSKILLSCATSCIEEFPEFAHNAGLGFGVGAALFGQVLERRIHLGLVAAATTTAKAGRRSTKGGGTDMQTPTTGETHKTSAASLVMSDKDGKVIWRAP